MQRNTVPILPKTNEIQPLYYRNDAPIQPKNCSYTTEMYRNTARANVTQIMFLQVMVFFRQQLVVVVDESLL